MLQDKSINKPSRNRVSVKASVALLTQPTVGAIY